MILTSLGFSLEYKTKKVPVLVMREEKGAKEKHPKTVDSDLVDWLLAIDSCSI